MSVDITSAVIEVYREAGHCGRPDDDIRAGLAAVLALPEVRHAIHDDVRRENEQKLRDLGVTGYKLGWDQ